MREIRKVASSRSALTWAIGLTIAGGTISAVGCGPEYAVVPQNGLPQAQATQSGVTLTAFANQWGADPSDLADHITPIAVDVYNGSPTEIRISYADFALRDETGFRYNAINPFVAAQSLGERLVPFDSTGVLLASRGHGGFIGRGYSGGHGVYVHGAGRGPVFYGPRSWGYAGHAWAGFHIAPGLRFYYGPGALYWGAPFGYPPAYWGVVYGWGMPYYPYRPSQDVLSYALPEGVIAPGGHVNGFVYFQNATARGAQNLTLTWEIRDAKTNAIVGADRVPLAIVKR